MMYSKICKKKKTNQIHVDQLDIYLRNCRNQLDIYLSNCRNQSEITVTPVIDPD